MVYLPHWPIPATFGNRQIDYESVFIRLYEVLQRLDNPHHKLPAIIHVAGTNGKGSTIAFLNSILNAHNLTCHIYTSPHLHNVNERIVLRGTQISDNFLYEIMEEVRVAAAQTPLTFFEGLTIGAILAFSKIPADIALIECGMGARIDATNIIEKKLATIITPISYDHTEYLGPTIEHIAMQKAHIIRPQTPVIIGPQPGTAKEIIKIIATDQKAKMLNFGEDFDIILSENKKFDFNLFDEHLYDLNMPALCGQHQYINAAMAIACTKFLYPNIKNDEINNGLKNVKWPSRLEKINNKLNKILKNSASEIFIDGAHNAGGAYALVKWLKEQKEQDEIIKKNFVICGFTKNKCKKEFLENFLNIADLTLAIRVEGEPNPEDALVIKKIGDEIRLPIKDMNNLEEAIYYLSELVKDDACRIIICGSLHLARDVRKFV